MHCTQRSSKKEKRSSPLLAAEVFIDTTPASSRFGSPPAQLTAILKEFVLFLDHFSSAELGKPFAFSMNSILLFFCQIRENFKFQIDENLSEFHGKLQKLTTHSKDFDRSIIRR